MAATEKTVQRQTEEIVFWLFNDEDRVKSRVLDCHLETDSPDDFDPVLIADKLRNVADALNEDANFRKALDDLKKEAEKTAIDAVFENGVELLCKNHVTQKADIAPEMQLIQASAAFGLYLKKSYPELKANVRTAMISFLDKRVGKWIAQKGGWGKVGSV